MNKIRTLKFAVCSIFCIVIGIFLTTDAGSASETIKKSIDVCLGVIIPSLFAFMALSSFMLSSGISSHLFTPLYYISKFWFKGDAQLFSVFVVSLFGGYPVGVKLISGLITYNKNYSEIGAKYLSFCYCPSPSFVIGIVGLGMFSDIGIGIIVYISNALACVTAALVLNIFTKREKSEQTKMSFDISLNKLSEALTSTLKALSVICSSIILFNIFNAFLKAALHINNSFLSSVVEISNITQLPADFSLLPFYAALFSTGGFCIIFQTLALAGKGIKITAFLLARIPCAILSALYCYFIIISSDVTVTTSTSQNVMGTFSSNPICSICLIIMCYILLKSQKKFTANSGIIK